MQTFTLHHLTDISPTCWYLFPAEGADGEEGQSGGVRSKNSQSYFGDYSQEQPAPDRAECKVSGLHHYRDAPHLLVCIKICLTQRYSVPISHLQVLQREHQKTKANRIISRLKQIKQEDEVVTHNFNLSNMMSRTIRYYRITYRNTNKKHTIHVISFSGCFVFQSAGRYKEPFVAV